MAKSEKKMRSGHLPGERWVKDYDSLDSMDLKYSGEFNQEQDYKRSVDGLANYVRKNREER